MDAEPFWSPQPLAAVRLHKVVWSPASGYSLSAVSRPERYGRTATARCPRRRSPCRPAPGPRCHCGLWACPTRDELFAAVGGLLGCAVSQVSLSGTVVEHAHPDGHVGGWRAQHLEVHALSFPATCWCARPTATLAVAPRLAGPTSAVLAWCADCAARLGVTGRTSPDALGDALGVEVSCDDTDPRLGPDDAQRALLATWWA